MPGPRTFYVLAEKSPVDVFRKIRGGIGFVKAVIEVKDVTTTIRGINLRPGTPCSVARALVQIIDAAAPDIRPIIATHSQFNDFIKTRAKGYFQHYLWGLLTEEEWRTVAISKGNSDGMIFADSLGYGHTWAFVAFTDLTGVRIGIYRYPTAGIYRWRGSIIGYNQLVSNFEDFLKTL